jgi:hypothetical protein
VPLTYRPTGTFGFKGNDFFFPGQDSLEKQEVDFLISESNKPKLLIETKLSDTNPSKSLIKFQRYLEVLGIQLVLKKNTARIITNDKNKILIVSAPDWLGMLP